MSHRPSTPPTPTAVPSTNTPTHSITTAIPTHFTLNHTNTNTNNNTNPTNPTNHTIPNPDELYHHLYVTQQIPQQFRIKMHYEPQYLWQDETIERRWCIECTTCPYNNFDLTNTICDIVHQCTIGNQIWIVNCDAGYGQIFTIRPHILPLNHVLLPSSPQQSQFSFSSSSSSSSNDYHYYHQIQIVQNATTINNGVYTNGNPTVVNSTTYNNNTTIFENNNYSHMLCLERTDTRYVTIQLCQNYTTATTTTTTTTTATEYNAPQLAQLWNPLVSYEYDLTKQQNNTNLANDGITISNTSYPTFTITPGILLAQDMDTTTTTTTNNNNSTTTTTTWCLTNQHHPKSEEIVALKPCRISNQYDTGFWNIYPLP